MVMFLSTALVAGTAGCTAFSGSSGSAGSSPSAPQPHEEAVASAPQARLTLVADTDPMGAAVSMSRALFDVAPVVVLARDGDRPGTLLAASAAVALGVPVLLQPADGGPTSDAVETELHRLGAEAVLAVGDAGVTATEGDGGPRVVTVPQDVDAVAQVAGHEFRDVTEVPTGGDVDAIAGLDGAAPAALVADSGAMPGGEQEVAGAIPAIDRGDPLTDTVVLATGEAGSAAAVATARAAGAQIVVTGGRTDPRGSDDVLDALADSGDGPVVALGSGFPAEQGLDWKLATAATGARLPGGGQLLFPGRMLVALYGHPGSGALGVLGEQGVQASIDRARKHAEAYESLVDVPVVPAFEIIATVASSAPGADGDYSSESDPDELRPWVEAAGEAGVYVVLDLQPGRADFLTQAQRYESLLELPHVGLALDP
jgi:hypothetical protein